MSLSEKLLSSTLLKGGDPGRTAKDRERRYVDTELTRSNE